MRGLLIFNSRRFGLKLFKLYRISSIFHWMRGQIQAAKVNLKAFITC